MGPASFYKGTVTPENVTVLPDGGIDVYLDYPPDGYSKLPSAFHLWSAGYVEQLTTNGALNRRFGNYGRANVALLGRGRFIGGSMLVDTQGNIIVASVQEFGFPNGLGGVGEPPQLGVDYDGVLRLTPAGHRDPRFGRNGITIVKSGKVSLPGAAAAWFAPQNGDIVIEAIQREIVSESSTVDAILDSPLRVNRPGNA